MNKNLIMEYGNRKKREVKKKKRIREEKNQGKSGFLIQTQKLHRYSQ